MSTFYNLILVASKLPHCFICMALKFLSYFGSCVPGEKQHIHVLNKYK